MISLYTWGTPNGQKVSIMLEEVGLPYTVKPIDLSTGVQKAPDYVKLNPNGRIPTIVDHDAGDFAVFESGAILLYLAEKTGKLLPSGTQDRSRVMQWLMFQMAGLGPMQGQANHFVRYAPEKIPYAIERYQKETLRLFGVLDAQLARAPYLAGPYSIADVATYPWIAARGYAELKLDSFPHLKRWCDEVEQRPAVARGMRVPQ